MINQVGRKNILKNLTEGNIYKNFLIFAIPLILSGVLSQGFNLVNSAIAGKYLGEIGRAATGSTAGFIAFVSSLLWGYCTGVALKSAIHFGSKNYDRLCKNFFSSLIFMISACLTLSLLCIIFKEQILDFLKVDPEIRYRASNYFVIYISSLVFMILNVFFVKFFQALGMSLFPTIVSITTTAVGILLRILSIVVLEMNVEGIALAAALSALGANVVYMIKAIKCLKELGCKNIRPTFCKEEFQSTLRLALPVSLQQGVMYIANFIISPSINVLGKSATAAYSVSSQIFEINAAIYQNSAITVMNYTAQSVGAKKRENLKRGVRVGFLQGCVFLIPILVLTVILARPLCSIFFESGYVGKSLDLSLLFVRVYLPFVFANVINNLFHNFFRGVKAVTLVLVSTALGSVVRIICTLILSPIYGLEGVYSGWVISWIAEAIFITLAYLSGIWKKSLDKY